MSVLIIIGIFAMLTVSIYASIMEENNYIRVTAIVGVLLFWICMLVLKYLPSDSDTYNSETYSITQDNITGIEITIHTEED